MEVVPQLDLTHQLDLFFAKIIKILQRLALELLEAGELGPEVAHVRLGTLGSYM